MKKRYFFILILGCINLNLYSQDIFVDSVAYVKVNPPLRDTICFSDTFTNIMSSSVFKVKVLSQNLKSGWYLFYVSSAPSKLYPKTNDSFTYPYSISNGVEVCIETNTTRGYGSIILRVEDMSNSATRKNVKFSLLTKDSFIKIASDSVTTAVNSLSTTSTIVKLKNKFINISDGDKIRWKLQNTKLNIPSSWKLNSIKDNNQVYPYTGVNMENIFDYSTPTSTEDNSLEVEIQHNKADGIGTLILSVNRLSDSTATVRNIKYTVVVSNKNSLHLVTDENDLLLYYFNSNLYIDSKFVGNDLLITDLSGKIVYKEVGVKSQTLDLSRFGSGIYIATILDRGGIIKSIKFANK